MLTRVGAIGLSKRKPFDTLAEALAHQNYSLGDTVVTSTHSASTAGGGGGEFVIVASGSGTDGIGYWDTDDGAFQLELRPTNGRVDVKQFGAAGDGTTDDTSAIQAAIDYLAGLSPAGGEVYFPRGTYIVSTSILQEPRVSLIGAGSRQSIIKWDSSAGLGSYEKGVVYCVSGTDASPGFVFSTNIEGLQITANAVAPVALALRGHQENCRCVDLLLGGFTDAGLDILAFSSVNHAITFTDIQCIPDSAATSAYGIRAANIEKCHFRNITTDIANPGSYARGISISGNSQLNVFEAIHTEDCEYGVYLTGGSVNTFIGMEALHNQSTGIAHIYTTSSRLKIINVRTKGGFTYQYQDPSRTISAGTDTDSSEIHVGGNYFQRISDTEGSTITLGDTRVTRGADAYAGTTGVGQTYLRVNASISPSATEYVVIDMGGSGTVGFAGKLTAFSTGDVRYAAEVLFAGYGVSDGSVTTAEVSTPVESGSSDITFGAPEALATPEAGKFRIPITNTSGSFSQILEIKVEISITGQQAEDISIV
jgi:hypothetical protein